MAWGTALLTPASVRAESIRATPPTLRAEGLLNVVQNLKAAHRVEGDGHAEHLAEMLRVPEQA